MASTHIDYHQCDHSGPHYIDTRQCRAAPRSPHVDNCHPARNLGHGILLRHRRRRRLSREAAETSAALLKAVADPVRLQLLSAIRATADGEACVCDLTPVVGLSQPTVSHHLKVLVEAGLLEREKRGTWAWFRLVPARLDDVTAIFR